MVRTVDGLSQVHGVLVVLALRRVYATAAANNTHGAAGCTAFWLNGERCLQTSMAGR